MSVKRRAVLAVLTPALLLAAAGTAAHRLRAAISTVLFNPNTGQVEVMHRFYVHDAEQVLGHLLGSPGNLLDDREDRLRFAAYVHERFALADDGGTRLPLTLVGAELDGDHLWVYQKTPIPERLPRLTVSHDAVRDVWPDQVNTVNVERGGRVRTLTFTGGTRTLSVALE